MHYKLNVKKSCQTFEEIFASDSGDKSKRCEHYGIKNLQTAVMSTDGTNLTTALSFLYTKVFFFGITGYYRASLCLLGYQLGQLDHLHAKVCDCSNTEVTEKHSNVVRKNDNATFENVLSPEGQKTLESKYIDQDTVLYQAALRLFLQRVLIVEQETGMQLLCAHTDGEAIVVMKRTISNPDWNNHL
jgi:hypothetical protein